MGINPAHVDAIATTTHKIGMLIGNAMSVNVTERILYRYLSAAGIISQSEMQGRWGTLVAARKTVRSFA